MTMMTIAKVMIMTMMTMAMVMIMTMTRMVIVGARRRQVTRG